jgi:protein CpxP
MRKTLTAALIALTLPTLALAGPLSDFQRGGDHGPRHFNELNLTREQSRDIKKLFGDQIRAQHEITQRYLDKLPASDKKAMQDELKAAKDKQQSGVRALLTPEQQKAYESRQKEMEERRAEREEFKAWKAEKSKKAE